MEGREAMLLGERVEMVEILGAVWLGSRPDMQSKSLSREDYQACKHNPHSEHQNCRQPVIDCPCASMGSMNDETSSEKWLNQPSPLCDLSGTARQDACRGWPTHCGHRPRSKCQEGEASV